MYTLATVVYATAGTAYLGLLGRLIWLREGRLFALGASVVVLLAAGLVLDTLAGM